MLTNKPYLIIGTVCLLALAAAFTVAGHKQTDPRTVWVDGQLDQRYVWTWLAEQRYFIKRIPRGVDDVQLTVDHSQTPAVHRVHIPCGKTLPDRYQVIELTLGDHKVIVRPCSGNPESQLEPLEAWLGLWNQWFSDVPMPPKPGEVQPVPYQQPSAKHTPTMV